MTNINFRKKSGFTLIETFVAIVILVIVVLGPMSVLSRALSNNNSLRNEIIASYLAQEGLELAFRLRSVNPSKISHSVKYALDFENVSSGNPTDTEGLLMLKTKLDSGRVAGYGYDSSTYTENSIFSRMVSINKVDINSGEEEYLVTSEVQWKDGYSSLTRTKKVVGIIFK